MKFANLKKFIYFASAISVLLIFISLKSAVCLENISMSTTDSQNLAKAKASIQNKIQANLKLKAKNRNKKTYSFESPPGTIGAAKADSDKLTASKNVPNLKQTPVILSNWLMISSRTFRNNKFFPDIFMGADIPNYKIKVDPYDYRLNDAFQKDNNKENSPANEKLFWFRLTKEHIFYSSTVSDLNILGGNKIDHIKNANALKKTPLGLFCFNMVDKAGHDWRLCSEDRLVRNKWYCQVQKLRGINVENYCNNHDEDGDNDGDGDGNGNNKNIIYKNVKFFLFLESRDTG